MTPLRIFQTMKVRSWMAVPICLSVRAKWFLRLLSFCAVHAIAYRFGCIDKIFRSGPSDGRLFCFSIFMDESYIHGEGFKLGALFLSEIFHHFMAPLPVVFEQFKKGRYIQSVVDLTSFAVQ